MNPAQHHVTTDRSLSALLLSMQDKRAGAPLPAPRPIRLPPAVARPSWPPPRPYLGPRPNPTLNLAALMGAIAFLAACASATPEKVLRNETSAAEAGPPLCERMAADFGMTVTGGDARVGREFSVSMLDTAFAARGLYFTFKVTDADPAQACLGQPKGMRCDLVGPARLEIQSNAGRAAYQLRAGEAAMVSSSGAKLICREPAR